ncbi:class I SAM-dependent methyltransferase [Nonomuraea sp. LPB2021202275-12-8]|uniref:class I SAM-dependent methyltransferase n=1 Tax=Nonomuraea sp. LPB2021202275-12-8 TaxID=3120159 RepID=UPI00300C36D7
MAIPRDYDTDPERFRLASTVTARYLTGERGQHRHVADALTGAGAALVLDIGCGEGALSAALPAGSTRVVGLDAAAAMTGRHPRPVVRAEAAALPFADGVFDAAVAVNMLYHLDDPVAAIAEAHRVLAPGGMFVAASPSRLDSPELAGVWRPERSTFDAEDAPELLARVFGRVEVERWDAPLITLPDEPAVRDYLIARYVPPHAAAAAAARVRTPITVTKRGAFVYGRKE